MRYRIKIGYFLPYLVIILFSLMPVFFTWGKIPIWGDTIIPFNSNGLKNYLYQWNSLRGGMYFSLNYLPYFLFFRIIELFTRNIYLISAILLFLLKIVAGTGILRLAKFIFRGYNKHLYIFPIIFYLLSPAQLNASYYLYIYSFAPWFIYYIFKIIESRKVTTSDSIWISIILFFSSINLPNPKYLFHLSLISLLILIINLYLKKIKINFFWKNLKTITLTVLFSSYILIPQLIFISKYNPKNYDVHVKAGYSDQGEGIDFGESTLGRMWKLRKDSLNLNTGPREFYTKNPVINTLSYLFPILIVLFVVLLQRGKNKKNTKIITLLVLLIFYLFFSAGHNPPLGFIYGFLIDKIPLFAFLRTTAGASFFLSVFYSLLLFSIIVNQNSVKTQNLALLLLAICSCVVGYPILNGETYKNVEVIGNPDTNSRGFKIPDDYFKVKDFIDSFKFDSKVVFPGSNLAYISTSWGYFGVAIYDFLYNTDNIGCTKEGVSIKNIGLIFSDKTLLINSNCDIKPDPVNLIKKVGNIELFSIPEEKIRPHIYPSATSSAQASLNYNLPIIEFKKNDPTKYFIKIHKVRDDFILNFEENFNNWWQIYIYDTSSSEDSNEKSNQYYILPGNEYYQANTDEVNYYKNNGWLSALGGDFISKKYQNSIQNNNITNEKSWVSWYTKQANNRLITRLGGPINTWVVNTKDICKIAGNCRVNTDGTYEMELILEFLPQRIYMISVLIPVLLMLALTIRYVYYRIFQK